MTILSTKDASSCSLCSTSRIVVFSFLLSSLTVFRTSCVPIGSIWLTGSSMARISGIIASMLAIQILCFCPPESEFVEASLWSVIPTIFRASPTFLSISFGSKQRFSGPKATSSSTVVEKIWSSGFWNTRPTSFEISIWFESTVSSPLTFTLPENIPPDS